MKNAEKIQENGASCVGAFLNAVQLLPRAAQNRWLEDMGIPPRRIFVLRGNPDQATEQEINACMTLMGKWNLAVTCRQIRINMRITQAEMAFEAGINILDLRRIETLYRPITGDEVVRVLGAQLKHIPPFPV